MRTCEECGGSMDGMRPDAKVCSASCRAERSRRLRGVHYVAEARSAPRGGPNARSGLQVSYRRAERELARDYQRLMQWPPAVALAWARNVLYGALSDRQRARLDARDNGR